MTSPGECDLTIRCRRQCSLILNYFVHLYEILYAPRSCTWSAVTLVVEPDDHFAPYISQFVCLFAQPSVFVPVFFAHFYYEFRQLLISYFLSPLVSAEIIIANDETGFMLRWASSLVMNQRNIDLLRLLQSVTAVVLFVVSLIKQSSY